MRNRDPLKEVAYRSKYSKTHLAAINARTHAYQDRVKAAVIAFYSAGTMACAQCGINDIDVLCLDHVADDGAEQRKALFGSRTVGGSGFYTRLRILDFPPGLQVLCANCNLKKEVERRRRGRKYNCAALPTPK